MKRLTSIMALVFLVMSAAFAQGQGGGNGGGGGGAPATGANAVVHDSTLTGTGLTASPLGLAAGAVTVSKLGTNNVAQAGQVLTFNGTQLTWQTPAANNAAGPFKIVDSLGNEVGILIDPANYSFPYVVRYFPADDTFVAFYLDINGVPENNLASFYESTDCTGPSYFIGRSSTFTQPGVRIGGTFYYPIGTNQQRHIHSWNVPNGPCETTDFHGEFSPVAAVPIGDLGTPPFKLSR